MEQEELVPGPHAGLDAAPNAAESGADQEEPVDPSGNAGREAFGSVSDFGVQQSDLEAGETTP